MFSGCAFQSYYVYLQFGVVEASRLGDLLYIHLVPFFTSAMIVARVVGFDKAVVPAAPAEWTMPSRWRQPRRKAWLRLQHPTLKME